MKKIVIMLAVAIMFFVAFTVQAQQFNLTYDPSVQNQARAQYNNVRPLTGNLSNDLQTLMKECTSEMQDSAVKINRGQMTLDEVIRQTDAIIYGKSGSGPLCQMYDALKSDCMSWCNQNAGSGNLDDCYVQACGEVEKTKW